MKAPNGIPIIELGGCLLVPLPGDVGDDQSDVLTSMVLERIQHRAPAGLVIDTSGVWMIDSHLCSVLARLASAARLMGTEVVLCGLNPQVVVTLQMMDIQLPGVRSSRGLEEALDMLGVEVRRRRTVDAESLEGDDEPDGGDDAPPQRSTTTSVASS